MFFWSNLFHLFSKENRFDILIYECLLLGFLIGFISIYHHITFLLIFILFIHIIGTLYTEKRFDIIKKGLRTLSQVVIGIFRLIFNRLSNYLFHRSSPKVLITKKLPQKYLYNYHLKPINDLRLQQVKKSLAISLQMRFFFLAIVSSVVISARNC